MTADDFSRRLIRARVARGLGQSQLAEAADISAAQISRYETGKNHPRLHIVVKLAKALSVDPDWLDRGSDASDAPDIVFASVPPRQTAFTLLMPPELRSQVEAAAKASDRSMNDEIIRRLGRSFQPINPFGVTIQAQKEQLTQLMERKNTLVLLLSAIDERTAPPTEVAMLKRRLADVSLSIQNIEDRIEKLSRLQPHSTNET